MCACVGMGVHVCVSECLYGCECVYLCIYMCESVCVLLSRAGRPRGLEWPRMAAQKS